MTFLSIKASRPRTMFGSISDRDFLRTDPDRLTSALKASRAGAWWWEAESGTNWDDHFHQMYGLPTGGPRNFDTWVEAIHPDDRERICGRVRSVSETPGDDEWHVEFRAVLPDGIRWMSGSGRAERDAGGRLVRISGLNLDITERKRSEQSRQNGEERLKSALIAAGMIVWEWNPGTGSVHVSDNAAELLGLLPGTVLTHIDQGMSLIHPDDRDSYTHHSRNAIADLGSYHVRFRIVRPIDGRIVWLEERGQAIEEAGGNGIKLSGVATDITAQIAAEERLRTSEEKYRTLFERMDEGFCVIEFFDGPHGKLSDYVHIEANPAYTANAGIPNIVGQKVREMVPGEADGWVEIYRNVLLTGQPVRFERELVATGRFLELAAFRIEPAARKQVAVLFKDITERKQAEARLRDAEQQFRMLADNISQFAWTADAAGKIYWYNRRWHDYTGTTLEDMAGWGWTNVHHPDHLDRVVRRIQHSWDTGELWEDTFPLRGADGNYRWFLSRAVPIRDDHGRILRWFGTNTDVTEQRELSDRLRESDRQKDEFLATLAHELRNPLAPIRTGLQVMKMAVGDADAVERSRAMMERQVNHMTRLIDDLMDLSRIRQGKIVLQKVRMDLGEAIRSAVDTSRPWMDDHSHELILDVPAEPVSVLGDPTRLSQVFANLLNNAAKYTNPGGTIRLTATREGGDAVVTIRDNGVGIPASMLSKVFDMFTQVDQSLEKSQGGLGIGLNIVQRLVGKHGGNIEVHSGGPGAGSTFTVRIPTVSDDPTSVATPPAKDALPSNSTRRILIVDDNRDGAESLAMLLELMGHETRVAHDGLDALDVAEAFRPNVILMDIGMPKLNGYEACRRIRQSDWGRNIIVVACTGWGQEEDKRVAIQAGFNFHMTKPVDPANLQSILG